MHNNPFREWALSLFDQPKEKKVTQTVNLQSADVQAYQKDLIDRAVRWARDSEYCDEFTEAMGELFPGVPALDSDGVDCHGHRAVVVNGNGHVDVAKLKAEIQAEIVDKAIRAARMFPNVVPANNARQALNYLFPGVQHVDSNGRGL